MPRPSWLLLVAMAIVTTACFGTSSSPGTSADPDASAEAPQACSNIDLRTPSGERIDLNGSWAISDRKTIAYVYQSGSCVWWVGGFATSETPQEYQFDGLGWRTMVFRGEIASDFTVSGDWSTVRGGPTTTWGTATMQITWDGNGETITLEPITFTGFYPFDGIMTKLSTEAIPPP